MLFVVFVFLFIATISFIFSGEMAGTKIQYHARFCVFIRNLVLLTIERKNDYHSQLRSSFCLPLLLSHFSFPARSIIFRVF